MIMEQSPNILLLYTGGTIGMVKDYATGSLKAFDFDNLMGHIPELQQLECSIESVAFENPIDSSNMAPKYWVQIATIIEDNYSDHDGFVVLHGSDTMSYSASALSFMLENLDKPVIFTGSQLPIGDLRTDAKENLITAIQLAALKENGRAVIQEVGLYFEYKLYRANRTTKVNAEHFEAFTSPSYPHLVESGVHLNVNYPYLATEKGPEKELVVHKQMDDAVGVLKLFPGISENFVAAVLEAPQLKVLVMETFGAGNATTEQWFLDLLRDAIQKGIHIINVTQCVGGSVLMGYYETSTKLEKIGLVNGKNITTESALTKAMYLLGMGISHNSFKTIFETSIRGEMH